MDIIFVGGMFSSSSAIHNNSIGNIQNAANNLQWLFIRGLYEKDVLSNVVSVPYIGTYPLHYKKLIYNGENLSWNSQEYGKTKSFFNLIGLNLISRYKTVKRELKKNKCDVIIIYSLHTPFLKAAIEIKKRNPKMKICLIVTDIPIYMSSSQNPIYRFLKRIEQNILNKYIDNIDYWVLLTEHMKKKLNICNKKTIVVEGMTDLLVKNKSSEAKESNFTMLYSGSLAKRYGVQDLIKAFRQIDEGSIRLWICGSGESEDYINQQAKEDNRIKFFGQVDREKVLEYQKRATLLVNPRKPVGEYVYYSFPSKIIEYFFSGTPTLMYELAGIPKEYYKYSLIIKKDGDNQLREAIMGAMTLTRKQLYNMGVEARKFVESEKNYKKQTQRVLNMLME